MTRRPPRSTLFPSPTLFRSPLARAACAPATRPPSVDAGRAGRADLDLLAELVHRGLEARGRAAEDVLAHPHGDARREQRSEEHTSELQSPCNLVCRLLLANK